MQGWCDFFFIVVGEQDVCNVGKMFNGIDFDVVYVSDMIWVMCIVELIFFVSGNIDLMV